MKGHTTVRLSISHALTVCFTTSLYAGVRKHGWGEASPAFRRSAVSCSLKACKHPTSLPINKYADNGKTLINPKIGIQNFNPPLLCKTMYAGSHTTSAPFLNLLALGCHFGSLRSWIANPARSKRHRPQTQNTS